MPYCEFLTCESDKTNGDVYRRYLCTLPSDNLGTIGVRGNCCSLGGLPCNDDWQKLTTRIGVNRSGFRRMRPTKGVESRMANGRLSPLVQAIPARVPVNGPTFEIAPAFANKGYEYYEGSGWCVNFHCPPLTPPTAPLDSVIHTCNMAIGSGWPMQANDPALSNFMHCAGCGTLEIPYRVRVINRVENSLGGDLNPPIMLRTWHNRQELRGFCTSNLMVLCAGYKRRLGDPFYSGNSNNCQSSAGIGFYYQQSQFRLWDAFDIVSFTGRFRTSHPELPDTLYSYSDAAEIEIKNAALAFVGNDIARGAASTLDLEQLSSARRGLNDTQDGNSGLDEYNADWNSNEAVQYASLPTVATLNARFRWAGGDAFDAEVVLRYVKIQMSMALHRITDLDAFVPAGGYTSRQYNHVFPAIKVRVVARLGLRIPHPPEGVTLRGTALTLKPASYARWFPAVDPFNLDYLVYTTPAGVQTTAIPPMVVWEGEIGPFSKKTDDRFDPLGYQNETGWQDIFAHSPFNSGYGVCCASAYYMRNGLTVPAYQTHQDSKPGGVSDVVLDGKMVVKLKRYFEFCN